MLKSKKSDSPPVFFSTYLVHVHTSQWCDVDTRTKAQWREFILKEEQGGLSLYTEEPCLLNRSHIDHFRRRSEYPQMTFDRSNLVVDGLSDYYGARYKDLCSCGELDYKCLIDPVNDSPERFFSYYGDGSIEPAVMLNHRDLLRAEYTIKVFNLNHPSLKERRRQIFDTFIAIDKDEAMEMASCFVEYGFPSVVKQIIDEYENCP